MIWPPSVARQSWSPKPSREGGLLLNKEGKRFMFGDIPDNYKAGTADNERRAGAIPRATERRRPPELLTRDHVAAAIVREIAKAAARRTAGSIWTSPGSSAGYPMRGGEQEEAAQHVSPVPQAGGYRYHQGADGGGPTTHYMMGGVRVDAESADVTVPGLFAAGNGAAGLHGANRLGETRSPTGGIRPARRAHAARFAKEHGKAGRRSRPGLKRRAAGARAFPAANRQDGTGPYKISTSCRR